MDKKVQQIISCTWMILQIVYDHISRHLYCCKKLQKEIYQQTIRYSPNHLGPVVQIKKNKERLQFCTTLLQA